MFTEIYKAWAIARDEALRNMPSKYVQMRLLINPETYRELKAKQLFFEHVEFQRPDIQPTLFDMKIIETPAVETWEICLRCV